MSDTAPATEATPVEAAVEPAVEAPVEPVVTEPTDTTVVEPTEAVEPVEPAEVDPFEAYGGKEAIEAAHRMYQAAQSEDGVIQLFLETGRALGLGLKDMQRMFTDPAAPAVEDPEQPDPDEPLTYGQWQEFQRQQQEQAAQAEAARVQAAAKAAVQTTVESLGLDPKDPATKIILQHADEHVKGDFSPANVERAVRQGYTDYQAAVEKHAQTYLQQKAQQAQTVPQAPAGAAAPAESPEPEPQNVTEAIKQARRRLGLSG